MIAERQDAADKVRYRLTGGASGTSPAGHLAAERRSVIGSAAVRILRKGAGAPSSSSPIPQGAGTPLSSNVRERMEPKLGADLAAVRIHTGAESASAAKGFGARAFTVGNDVHFNSGEFAPGSREGDRLLAHELTHVVQGQGTTSAVHRKAGDAEVTDENEHEVSSPDDPAELEADEVSDHVSEELHDDSKQKNDKKSGAKKPAAQISAKLYRSPLPIMRADGVPVSPAEAKQKLTELANRASPESQTWLNARFSDAGFDPVALWQQLSRNSDPAKALHGMATNEARKAAERLAADGRVQGILATLRAKNFFADPQNLAAIQSNREEYVRDRIGLCLAEEELSKSGSIPPNAQIFRGVDLAAKTPYPNWASMPPTIKKNGYFEFGGAIWRGVSDIDLMVAVPSKTAPGKLDIQQFEEIKTGARDQPGAPSTPEKAATGAMAQVETISDGLAKLPSGETKLLEAKSKDITPLFNMATVATATGKTRGPANKDFNSKLPGTSDDLADVARAILGGVR